MRILGFPWQIGRALFPEVLQRCRYKCQRLRRQEEIQNENSTTIKKIELRLNKFKQLIAVKKVAVLLEKDESPFTYKMEQVFGNASSGVIVFNQKILGATNEEIDFIICQALFHLKKNYNIKRCLLNISLITLDVAVAFFWHPALILLIEPQLFAIESGYTQMVEKEVSRLAVNQLGTIDGAITLLESQKSTSLSQDKGLLDTLIEERIVYIKGLKLPRKQKSSDSDSKNQILSNEHIKPVIETPQHQNNRPFQDFSAGFCELHGGFGCSCSCRCKK